MGPKLCLRTLEYYNKYMLCKPNNSENITHPVTIHLLTETQHSGHNMVLYGLEGLGFIY